VVALAAAHTTRGHLHKTTTTQEAINMRTTHTRRMMAIKVNINSTQERRITRETTITIKVSVEPEGIRIEVAIGRHTSHLMAAHPIINKEDIKTEKEATHKTRTIKTVMTLITMKNITTRSPLRCLPSTMIPLTPIHPKVTITRIRTPTTTTPLLNLLNIHDRPDQGSKLIIKAIIVIIITMTITMRRSLLTHKAAIKETTRNLPIPQ
jgi:hypothetical protein